jgi:hypothetical protein
MIFLVLFVVFMALWLVGVVAELPAPLSRSVGLLGWLSVLSLFLLVHGPHG